MNRCIKLLTSFVTSFQSLIWLFDKRKTLRFSRDESPSKDDISLYESHSSSSVAATHCSAWTSITLSRLRARDSIFKLANLIGTKRLIELVDNDKRLYIHTHIYIDTSRCGYVDFSENIFFQNEYRACRTTWSVYLQDVKEFNAAWSNFVIGGCIAYSFTTSSSDGFSILFFDCQTFIAFFTLVPSCLLILCFQSAKNKREYNFSAITYSDYALSLVAAISLNYFFLFHVVTIDIIRNHNSWEFVNHYCGWEPKKRKKKRRWRRLTTYRYHQNVSEESLIFKQISYFMTFSTHLNHIPDSVTCPIMFTMFRCDRIF